MIELCREGCDQGWSDGGWGNCVGALFVGSEDLVACGQLGDSGRFLLRKDRFSFAQWHRVVHRAVIVTGRCLYRLMAA